MKRTFRFLALIALGAVTAFLFGNAQQVLAAAAYHGNWAEQPTWGNHWWWSDGVTLTWDADDWWDDAHVNALRNGHNNFPNHEYRIEQEAYDPGLQASCDRLVIKDVIAMQLPIQAAGLHNGCGKAKSLEELHIELNENAIQSNVWYRHRVTYTERRVCGKKAPDGEVNYAFSHNHEWRDSWLGKITYDKCLNRTGSDPNGMVN
ncbi:hypothetical protein FBQ82_14965 [Anaerolineae bacterium CFX7]|nr:hypothetical protein [Anaerolineae bacterium CFX7]